MRYYVLEIACKWNLVESHCNRYNRILIKEMQDLFSSWYMHGNYVLAEVLRRRPHILISTRRVLVPPKFSLEASPLSLARESIRPTLMQRWWLRPGGIKRRLRIYPIACQVCLDAPYCIARVKQQPWPDRTGGWSLETGRTHQYIIIIVMPVLLTELIITTEFTFVLIVHSFNNRHLRVYGHTVIIPAYAWHTGSPLARTWKRG